MFLIRRLRNKLMAIDVLGAALWLLEGAVSDSDMTPAQRKGMRVLEAEGFADYDHGASGPLWCRRAPGLNIWELARQEAERLHYDIDTYQYRFDVPDRWRRQEYKVAA